MAERPVLCWRVNIFLTRLGIALVVGCHVACLTAAAAGSSGLSSDQEQAAKYDFDIPAHSLSEALQLFAQTTQLQIARLSEVDLRQTRAVSGRYTAAQALDVMLENSELTYRYLNDHTIAITRRNTAGAEFTNPGMLQATTNKTSNEGLNKMERTHFFSRLLAFLGMTAAAGNGAFAQTDAGSAPKVALEEVIVTAQRREENLQSAPVAVTAVSGATLDAMNVQSLYDIGHIAPNVQFGGGFAGSTLYVRGIGQQQSGLLSDPGAVIYIDGVYRPRMTGNSTNFSDAQRVEVLRGPQGTLFGKNAIGGAVNIVSLAPSDELGGSVEAQGGSRNRAKIAASANLPIVQDQLAARLSIESNKQDGYMKDLYTGERLDDTNYYTAHGSLLWKLSDALSITLRGDYTKQNQNSVGNKPLSVPNPAYLTAGDYETRGDAPSYNRAKDTGMSATLEWHIGPGTLKSITAQRHWNQRYGEDSDGTPDPVNRLNNSSAASDNFVSEELQYNAKLLNDRLDLTAGAFYMDEHVLEGVFPRLGGGPVQLILDNYRDQTTKSYAAFAQGTYALIDKLNLTLGLRYSKDSKDVSFLEYNYAPFPGNPTFPLGGIDIDSSRSSSYSAVTPKATLDYRFTPDVMIYASASRGFKAGGFNGQPTTPDGFVPFSPEYVWNYELGLKSEWFDKRVRANLVAYRMNYTDMQLAYLDVTTGIGAVGNVGAARINGLEAEFNVLLTPSLLLNASLGLNDFKFTEIGQGTQNVTTSTAPVHSPKSTAAGGAEYTINLVEHGRVVLRADYSWTNKSYYNLANTEAAAQDAYGLWSARATYASASGHWSVFAYGINLADKFYTINGQEGLGQVSVAPAPPREVGAGFTVKFGR